MNISLEIIFSTTGCLPFLISIIPFSLILGLTKLFCVATTESDAYTSIIAIALAVFCILTTSAAMRSLTSQNKSYSSEYSLSSAPRIISSRCFNSSVVYLSEPVRVCFRTHSTGTRFLNELVTSR